MHRGNLVLNETHVMRNVVGDAFEKRLQSQWSGFGMHAGSLKVLDVGLPQNTSHLLSNDGDQIQFLENIAMLVVQARRENIRISAKQRWIVFHQHTFHSIGVNWLKVRKVANDLLDRPFPLNRMLRHLILSRTLNRRAEQVSTLFVLLK